MFLLIKETHLANKLLQHSIWASPMKMINGKQMHYWQKNAPIFLKDTYLHSYLIEKDQAHTSIKNIQTIDDDD